MFLKDIRLESLYVLGLLIISMSVLSPYFLSISNFLNILLATSVIGILAIGSTFVISSAGLDLSVGSVMGLAGVAGAVVMNQLGLNWVFGILACIIAGGIAGFFNGQLVTRAKIPAFIVTLGMLGVARGAALLLCDGKPIYGLSDEFLFLGQGRPFGIPFPVIIFLGVAILTHYILSSTKFGKHTLVIGDNQNAAVAMGIKVNSHKVKLYAFSGGLAGVAGMIFTSRVNAGDPTAGFNYELTAITAAIIGGTNLFGGKGSIIGTFIGALIMGVLQNGLNLLAVQSYYQRMAIGAVLIIAVWFDQINRKNK
tara:strand:- start:279 stop:1208 length:930 start_codon:yes stop_codon:yes gene_type:complete